ITIVQVIGDDHAVFSRALHCFDGHFRSCLGERAEDPSGMKPARALFAEDCLPIDLTWLKRRHRRVAAIGAAQSRSQAKAALRKIQAVADGPADAVIVHPSDQRRIDAALINQVLEEESYWIFAKAGTDRG